MLELYPTPRPLFFFAKTLEIQVFKSVFQKKKTGAFLWQIAKMHQKHHEQFLLFY